MIFPAMQSINFYAYNQDFPMLSVATAAPKKTPAEVLPWRPRTEGVAEHLVGLHKAPRVYDL